MVYSIIKKSHLEGALRLDAEYYQPEFLNIKNIFFNRKNNDFRELSMFVKKGIFDISPEKYIKSGIPLVRVQNIKNGMIDNSNMVYLSEKNHNIENKTELSDFDFVLSKIGTVGEIALLDPKYKKWNFSQNVIGIKLKKEKISPAYVLFFLLSKFGQLQIKRAEMGQVQPKLELEDIRNLKIIRIKEEKIFKDYLEKILELRSKAELFYQQAENILLEELGLKDFNYDKSLFSIVNLSEVVNANRIDAEYFQEKYKKLVKKIKLNKAKKLGDLVSIKKGFEPGSEEYHEEGRLFIRVSTLSKNGINLTEEKYLSEKLYQELKKDYNPEVGEILLTKDATPGIAYVIKEPVEGIMSGGILRLKLKENIDVEYLTLCLNSIVGQMQAERDSGGSVIAHWKPEQIKKLLIPILPKPTQQKIADLIRQSHEARKKDKELLEEAKKKVEEIIERGGDKYSKIQ